MQACQQSFCFFQALGYCRNTPHTEHNEEWIVCDQPSPYRVDFCEHEQLYGVQYAKTYTADTTSTMAIVATAVEELVEGRID